MHEQEQSEGGPSGRVASIYAEYLARRMGREGHEDSELAELYRQYPELAPDLRRLHEARVRIDAALGEIGRAGSAADRLESRSGPDVGSTISLEAESAAPSGFSSDVVRRLSDRAGAFGRYRIKGEIARGGMGAILRVWDEDLRRYLAMKVMLGAVEPAEPDHKPEMDTRSLGRFLEEAQVTGQLDHPGIVPVHELGLDPEGRVYFTMKLVKGRTLREIFGLVARGEEGWTLTRALGVILKVCEAMSYAHAKDVVHRDLKPSNIMVGRFGEVYVMDWGLARIVGSKDEKDIRIRAEPETSVLHSERHENLSSDAETPLCTMDGDVVGTPAYMSPEQAEGRLDELGPRSDVYSVGAILYHLISGQVPYVKERMKANNYAIWRWVQAGPPDPLEVVAPNAPPEIISICERAMDRDASQRYPTIGDLAAELRAYLEGRVVLSHRTGLAIELRKWTQRNQLAAAALAGAALFLLVVAATVYWVQSSKLSAIEAEQAQTLAAKQRAEALSRTVAEAAAAALALRKENLVMQADYAIETANLAQVEVLMAEYRGLDPEDFLPHLVLARGYSQYLRGAEAEREFRRARDLGYEDAPLDADDARGLYLRGLALVIERDPARLDEAIRCLSEAVRLDARMRAAYFPLYSLHKERGDLVSAEQALAAFHEILATGDDYYGVVAAFRAELQGRFQDAIDVLLRTQLRVGEARARELRLDRILGRLYLSQEAQHAESERSASALDAADLRLHAAVLSVPSDAASWANLGQVELRRYLRDPAGATAVEHLQRMLRYGRRAVLEHPRFAQGYRIVLNALVFTATRSFDPYDSDSKLLDEAREVAAELRNLDPQHPSLALMEAEIDFHAGMRAEALGQDEPAEELYLRSLARNPNQVLPRLWLAQRAYAREEFEAAVEQLREARSVLSRHAQEAAIRALPEVFITKLHIWTLGAAGRVEGPAAIELGLSAHEDIQAAIDDGREIETLELLNYVEFLATSPRAELRDCEEARRVFESHGLAEKLRGTPYAESVRAVEAALRDC